MNRITCKAGVLSKTIRLLPFITIYANPIKAGWKDFAIDIGWLRRYKGYNKGMWALSNGWVEDKDITHWIPIPSFDEILEANKDVLERIKEKGD